MRNEDKRKYELAVASYLRNYREEFAVERDIHNLLGEQNIFRYLPLKNMLFRIYEKDELVDILMVLAAARISKTSLYVSVNQRDSRLDLIKTLTKSGDVLIQTEDEFTAAMNNYERVRTCSADLSEKVFGTAARFGKYIAMQQPLVEGRLELLNYLKEQSVTYEYHRYGSITEKPEL